MISSLTLFPQQGQAMIKKLLCLTSTFFSSVYAQSNTYQYLQPFDFNYLVVTQQAIAPTPSFRVMSDNSTTPTIGTAGSFTRASTFYRFSSKNSLQNIAANNTAVPSFAAGENAPSTTTLGGVLIYPAITNYALQNTDFSNASWVKSAGCTVTANSVAGPSSSNNADTIAGTGSTDGVTQTTSVNAVSNIFSFYVWLRASTGTPTVQMAIRDTVSGQTSGFVTKTLSTTFQQFKVTKEFSSAAGVVEVELRVGNTTGYSVYADKAGIVIVGGTTATADQLGADWEMASYPDTAAATVAYSTGTLTYSGSELTASSNKRVISVWFYVPYSTLLYLDKTIFSIEKAGITRELYAVYAQRGFDDIEVSYAGDNLMETGVGPISGRWNHLLVKTNGDTGSNFTCLNGALIHSDTTTFAAYSAAFYLPAQVLSDGSLRGENYTAPVGTQEIWVNPSKEFNSQYCFSIYSSQKVNYGL